MEYYEYLIINNKHPNAQEFFMMYPEQKGDYKAYKKQYNKHYVRTSEIKKEWLRSDYYKNYSKQYDKEVKEGIRIKNNRKEKVICECGIEYHITHKKQHMESNRHKNGMIEKKN